MVRPTIKKEGGGLSIVKSIALFGCGFLACHLYYTNRHNSLSKRSNSDSTLSSAVSKNTTTLKTTATTTTITNKEADNAPGWNQIDVFFGNHDQLSVDRFRGLDQDQIWQSQADQDHVVFQLFNGKKDGYFIDLAANDATMISNTYALETHHDWKGLCMEPNPVYWPRLAYRKCKVIGAVVGQERMEEIDFNFQSNAISFGGRTTWDMGVGGGISGKKFSPVKANKFVYKRYTVTIGEIFERHSVPKVIDYFSLDVERAETSVMMGFPFESYTFKVMTVEQPQPELKELLLSKGYIRKGIVGDGLDEVWVHSSFEKSLSWDWTKDSPMLNVTA